MYRRIHLLNLGILAVLGLVITAACSNLSWTTHYKVTAQPESSPQQQQQPSTAVGGALTYVA